MKIKASMNSMMFSVRIPKWFKKSLLRESRKQKMSISDLVRGYMVCGLGLETETDKEIKNEQ